ncbi:MAG: lipoate--protein ligase family protein [Syntrophales bacterium]
MWRLVPFHRYPPRENMAIDEAIFREVQRSGGPPTVRLYGWLSPAVTIGHFQHIDREIDLDACRKGGVTVVRRPTGGKAVYHDDDLTYAVIAADNTSLFSPTILETYRVISQCLVRGLHKLGVEAILAAEGREPGKESVMESGMGTVKGSEDASCFSVPSLHELLVKGRKICGSAQMRSRGVFLQQGSLLMSFDPEKTYDVTLPHREPRARQVQALREKVTSLYDHLPRFVTREDVCKSLIEAFQTGWQVSLAEGSLTPEEETLKEHLLKTKYCDLVKEGNT